ncbi:MAG TPA: 50S ribosomal protein L11 methyltransferase [Parafilimonas sp.]|nr:50S ribosomal protein L11 methyltransferase [Parafilimonas sp.]
MAYIEIRFIEPSEEAGDILIAMLSDLRYEGFEEEQNILKAFIPKSLFNEEQLKELAQQFQLKYAVAELPDTNWNKVWESNFQPVIVENFCAVRAGFHESIKDVKYEIIITPKMSFGTGHHATTYMMLQQMQEINFHDKHVIDFGTGTGVLAILADKLGAATVIAIDNDNRSIENAAENFKNNNAQNIDLELADQPITNGVCDIILANITRNVIQENFPLFNKYLADKGNLLLSGLLSDDEEAIIPFASTYNFVLNKQLQRDNWISLKLIKDTPR